MDLKEREWGQMGVTIMQGTLGCTMLAPAANEYAVLPVGVAIMIPAHCNISTHCLLPYVPVTNMLLYYAPLLLF